MAHRSSSRKARARNIALILVLSIAAGGLLFRTLRPFWDEPPAPRRTDDAAVDGNEAVDLLRVIDGDTIEVRWRGGPERVRLLRIDTPERGGRGYGEATRALEGLLAGAALELEFERPGRPERDKYDRLLAYVLADGDNANVELVRLGWTRFWTRYGAGRLAEQFAAAERDARSERAGLWGPNGWNKPGE